MLGETVANNIKKYRKERGLTQNELGIAVSRSEVTIRKYEANDVNPDLDMIEDIAEALDIGVYDLIREKKYNKTRDYPERTELQGIQTELESYYFQMLDEHNLSNVEAVKVAMRFASFMTGLLK